MGSNRMNVIVTVVLILSMNFCADVTAKCNLPEVLECMSPIIVYSLGKHIPMETVNYICSNLTDVTQCIDRIGCMETDPISVSLWHGFRDGFGYVCQMKSNREIMTSDCLKSDEVSQSLMDCNDAYTTTIVSGGNSAQCPAASELLRCSKEAMRSCGKHVTTVYSTFTYKMLKPRCPDSLMDPSVLLFN